MSVTAPGASNIVAGLTKYTYDNRYQLVRAGYPNNSFDAWTYDAIGNRLSKTVLNGGTVTPYAYFTNAVGGNTQRLRNDGFYDFTYDADGDVTAASTQYGSTAYVWDHGNRLTSYGGTTYTYDSLGRTSATTSGSTTRYIGMNGNTVGERNTTSNVVTDYIFGPGIDEPLAKRTANGSITYYGVDGLGSVVVSTDPTGAVLNSTGYSPWGEMIFPTPELFGYTGRETGGPSWYYRARHGELYGYALNSPLLFRDPLGLKVLRCWRYLDLATGSALGKPLGGLLLGVVAAIYPPAAMAVPHNTTCLMHEFLYDTDLHTSVGSGPKGVETNETLKGATCREVPNAQGECAMKKFASVQGKYSAVTNNCHSAVQNALDACDECSQKYKP